MFYENGDLSKEDKRIFTDYIDRIEMSYIINSSTLNKLKKENQFNKKMELNIKASEISKKIQALKSK